MIACLQRVSEASVRVDGSLVGAIDQGLLVLLGVFEGDSEAEAGSLASRIARYRCFSDPARQRPMERSLLDCGFGALVVSQFTLCARTGKGLRPGFDRAMPPDRAEPLYERFVELLREAGVEPVEKGIFGAAMQVALVNDGPVTLLLEQRPGGGG